MTIEILLLAGYFLVPLAAFLMYPSTIDTNRGDGGLDDAGGLNGCLLIIIGMFAPLFFSAGLIASDLMWAKIAGFTLLPLYFLIFYYFISGSGSPKEQKKKEVQREQFVREDFSNHESQFLSNDPVHFSLNDLPELSENRTFTDLLRKAISEENMLVSSLTMYVDLYGTSCDPVSVSFKKDDEIDYVSAYECLRATGTYARQFMLDDPEDIADLLERLSASYSEQLLGEDFGEPWLMGSHIELCGETDMHMPVRVDRSVWIKLEGGEIIDVTDRDPETNLTRTDSRGVEEFQTFDSLSLYDGNPVRFHVAVGTKRSSAGVDHLPLIRSILSGAAEP